MFQNILYIPERNTYNTSLLQLHTVNRKFGELEPKIQEQLA